MNTYKIEKTQISTYTNAVKTAWNVIDPKDGYVFETFDLKRDAQAWINKAQSK